MRHLNNGTDRRHSKSSCDQSSPARRTMTGLAALLESRSQQLQALSLGTGSLLVLTPIHDCGLAALLGSRSQQLQALSLLTGSLLVLTPIHDCGLVALLGSRSQQLQALSLWTGSLLVLTPIHDCGLVALLGSRSQQLQALVADWLPTCTDTYTWLWPGSPAGVKVTTTTGSLMWAWLPTCLY